MRIAVASIAQETSSFTSLRTTLDDFQQKGYYEGEEALVKAQGVGALGGFLSVAETEKDVTLLPIISSYAGAGGPIAADTLAYFQRKLVAGLQAALPLDGVFLFLHGGSAAEGEPDPEGALLEATRQVVGPQVPIVVGMDHHASITRRTMANLDGLVAHRTQPHDPFDTGQRAGKILFALLRGAYRPAIAWQRIPLITHQEQFLTTVPGPMKEWFDLARQYETIPGVVAISNFPMQPWLDVPEGGWATVVITAGDMALARRLCADLANKAWSLRERFLQLDSVSPAEAIRRAVAAERGLVVLSDTGDSVFGGAAGASTVLLREMLRQQITCTALVPMFDPESARQLTQAGVGAHVTLDLGAKADTAFYAPVRVSGRVAALGSGRITAKVGSNESFDMGQTALLEIGSIKVVVSEYRGIGGNHPVVYRRFGIEPAEAKIVVLKTASNFQYYAPMTSEVIRADTPGPTMSHIKHFNWQYLARPIYPLENLVEWRVEA